MSLMGYEEEDVYNMREIIKQIIPDYAEGEITIYLNHTVEFLTGLLEEGRV